MRFPFLSSKRITLNIEANSVRVLVAQGDAVEKWASIPLEPGLVEEGLLVQPQKVGEAIGQLFRTEKLPRGKVITCLSGARALSHTITLPKMEPTLLRNAVMYQAKREMPVPIEELVMAWQVVDSSERHQEIFVVGVPRDVMQAHLDALKQAGINPSAVDLKPLALARAVNRPTAVIGNLEADSIDILYMLDDVPLLMRSIAISEVGVPTTELRDRLVEELERTIRYYNDTNREHPVGPNTPIFLTGGVGDFLSLASALYGRLEYTLEPLSPPLRCPEGMPVEQFAVNIGLARKGI